jgi:thiamine monophosphate kinase
VPSEFELIRRYFVRTVDEGAPGPERGASVIGDDCALLAAPSGLALASRSAFGRGHAFPAPTRVGSATSRSR